MNEHSQTPPSSLFIIDGMSLLFRSFYALGNKLVAPNGIFIGAVFGFLRIVIKFLQEHKPTHFAICWDLKEKTFRHEVFPLYKSHRGTTPPEIIPQIELVQKLLAQMQIPCFSQPGYEADDLACTLAKYFEHYGYSYIITLDKDFMQVVNDKIFLLSLKKGDAYDILNEEKIFDFFGVSPSQVTDVLALTGDASDFIPGVKGIGEKTAAKLINEFNSLEELYQNLDKVLNKRIQTLLLQNKDQAFLSKYLVTIKTDVPMNVTEEALRYSFAKLQNNSAFAQSLNDLHLHQLTKLIYGEHNNKINFVKATKNSLMSQRNYHLVTTQKQVLELCAKIANPQTVKFALDTETTGLDIIYDKPIGISLCFSPGNAYYCPLHPIYFADKTVAYSPEFLCASLQQALQQRKALLIGHNLKFDLHQLKNIGLSLGDGAIACTMIAAWLCDPTSDIGFSLDALVLKHFAFSKIPTSKLIGKEIQRKSMLEVPLPELVEYACEDVDTTLQLWKIYEQKLRENLALEKLFFTMEMPVLLLLAQIERNGVYINQDYLNKFAQELQNKLTEIEGQIFEKVGFNFKLSSPKQLGNVLFESLKVHEILGYKSKLARTTQGYKTDNKVLEEFANHEVVSLVIQHRELSKLLNTYVLVLPTLVKEQTQRVHSHFNQIGTATGRLSSSDPNMQNIPIRTLFGRRIRAAFSAQHADNKIVCADYSQIELRVLAHLSQDQNMLAAFSAGVDIHTQTAAQIFGKNIVDVNREERTKAKAINFGIIYGMGAQRLAREQKIPLAQAKDFIEKYFANFTGVKRYLANQRELINDVDEVKTYFGRIRKLSKIHAKNALEIKLIENIAINSPIQGTAADIMKLGMLAVAKELQKYNLKAQIILQVHDELVLEVPSAELELVKKILTEAMEGAVQLSVPMLVELGIANNWLEAK